MYGCVALENRSRVCVPLSVVCMRPLYIDVNLVHGYVCVYSPPINASSAYGCGSAGVRCSAALTQLITDFV